jgi:hypothetical protein
MGPSELRVSEQIPVRKMPIIYTNIPIRCQRPRRKRSQTTHGTPAQITNTAATCNVASKMRRIVEFSRAGVY